MSSSGAAAPCAAVTGAAAAASPARAEASRRNGARSRGPTTPEGKARSSRNALRHGLCAQRHVVLHDEDAAAFRAQERALLEALAPAGALETLLARRIAAAAWRLERAERIENELFAIDGRGHDRLGLALIRDGHGARAFPTLLRYRGAATAELLRLLRALETLQAEAARPHAPRAQARHHPIEPGAREQPIEPEARRDPGSAARHAQPEGDAQPERDPLNAHQAQAAGSASEVVPTPPARQDMPIEPEAGGNPGEIAPAPQADEPQAGSFGAARPAPSGDGPCGRACVRAPGATPECATMGHSCAIHAPPSAGAACDAGPGLPPGR